MKTIGGWLLALGLLFFASNTRFVDLEINGSHLTAEIADTPRKHQLGLMHRLSIPNDYAMLFVFSDEQYRSFWMKNTKIRLDIIYLDPQKQVVDMYINVPPCLDDPCPSYASHAPARYVVELQGNRARDLHIKIGDRFFFLY